MSAGVRIFAALAVSALGLGAIKGLQIIGAAPEVFDAAAWAADAPKADAAAPKDDHGDDHGEANAALEEKPEACAAPSGPPSLAERSGLTASELRVLQSLSERRREMDARSSELDTREALLLAAEQRVEERRDALVELRDEINALLGQLDEAEEQQLAGLVTTYEKMKAKDAAAIFAALDPDILLRVASRMKETSIASILAEMDPRAAGELTVRLATRLDSPESAADLAAAREG
ncbi:MAG: MotE family protein [Maricaulaceae bacterium]